MLIREDLCHDVLLTPEAHCSDPKADGIEQKGRMQVMLLLRLPDATAHDVTNLQLMVVSSVVIETILLLQLLLLQLLGNDLISED